MSSLTASARLLAVLLLLGACTTQVPSTSRLDSSGLTVVTNTDVILLARNVRTLAAGARDYAYVGPVEVNRMGHREYYFWLGLASTVDRDLAGLIPPEAVAVALIVDGVPMILPLTEWHERLDVAPYDITAPVYATLVAQTSLDQIRHIAAARTVEFHVIVNAGSTAHYSRWQGSWASWSEFATSN